MKVRLIAVWCMAVALMASQAGAAEKAVLKTQKDKSSYAIGIDIGGSLKKQPFEVDAALVAKGLKDAMSGGKTLMTDQEVKETLMALQGAHGKAAGAHERGR